jgi:hypothetical protein
MIFKDSTTDLQKLVLADPLKIPEWIDKPVTRVYFNIKITDNNVSTIFIDKYFPIDMERTQYPSDPKLYFYEFKLILTNKNEYILKFQEDELKKLIIYPYEFTQIYFANPLKIKNLPTVYFPKLPDNILSEGQGGEGRELSGSWNNGNPFNDKYIYRVVAKSNNTITIQSLLIFHTNYEAEELNKIIKADKERFNKEMTKYEQENAMDNENSITNYKAFVKAVEDTGNLRFYPHRLAHLNEIKTAAYYGADWDDIGWINDANPQLYNKSNLVKIQDKKVMWIDKEDKNAINKGVICYGRKINQEKIGANQKNEMYNFQMEKIEQSIKDIQKYENVSDFNKEVYSRWNL